MSSLTGRVSLQGLFLLTVIFSSVSGAPKFTITPDRGTLFNISNSQAKGCQICTGSGRTRRCSSSLILKDNTPVSVEFDCPRPQDVFNVEIVRNIECNAKSCNGHIIQADSGSLPLLDFNRRFIWNIKTSTSKAFEIDFTKTGLNQINPSQRCPDGHTYSLLAFQTKGTVALGTFCRAGPIRRAQTLNQGRFFLDVPGKTKLFNSQFDVSVGEELKSFAKISVTLPIGSSYSSLLSPNYPDSFPDDDQMAWSFEVPPRHKAVAKITMVTEPQCLKGAPLVGYQSRERSTVLLQLTDFEQTLSQGDLTLRNCKMNRSRANSPGLSVNIVVSVTGMVKKELCKVDFKDLAGLSLHIDKVPTASGCVMKLNGVTKEKMTITSTSDLFFEGCTSNDVHLTATRVIGCSNLRDCPKTPVALLVPLLPFCLPAPLSNVTWTLRPAQHGTVKLTSPAGPLKQSLPGQICNDSILFKVAEENGGTVGHFCPQGVIEKIQVHTNVSVTWLSNMKGQMRRSYLKYVLNATFEKEIPERYIFTVSPTKDKPVLVATPGWPVGMESYSTVSWIVSVPPKMEARLMFANLSQPKCSNRHTNIRVQRVGRREEDYSRREDEEAESEITVPESFYLNMSNCMPERGDFSVITKISLQKANKSLLTTILSVVAALLVVFVIVLVAVCVLVRKKKKKLEHQVSIYNPNGGSFLPGPNGHPRQEEDSESHVYASIEDTLVYTHLLKKGAEIGVYGDFDTYHSFSGQKDSQKPLVSRDGGNDEELGVYRPFEQSSQQGPPLPNRPPSHGQSLVDNDIYKPHGQSEEDNLGERREPGGGN